MLPSFIALQLKRLQIMLRQANEQLEVEERERERVDEKARQLSEECGLKVRSRDPWQGFCA